MKKLDNIFNGENHLSKEDVKNYLKGGLNEKEKRDIRLKHIFLTKIGQKLFEEIFLIQKKRIYKAFLNSSSKEVIHFDNVIKRIIDEKN